ncbi:hypothetical protein B1A90_12645, partial [Neisseria meningitidis]
VVGEIVGRLWLKEIPNFSGMAASEKLKKKLKAKYYCVCKIGSRKRLLVRSWGRLSGGFG